jgi:hypothetical protein
MPALGSVIGVELVVAELAGAVPEMTVTVPPERPVDAFGAARAGAVASAVGCEIGIAADVGAVALEPASDNASGAAVPGITTVAVVGIGSSFGLLQPHKPATITIVATPDPRRDDSRDRPVGCMGDSFGHMGM